MSAGGEHGLHAEVAIPVPLRRLFTYSVPQGLAPKIEVGARVRVPLGPRRVVGTVVAFPAPPPQPGVAPRPIEAVLEDAPRPTPELLQLTRFVADYYLCSWGEAIEAALPPGPPPRAVRLWVRRLPSADPEPLPPRAVARRRVLEKLPADGTPVLLGKLGQRDARVARELVKLGLVEIGEVEAREVTPARAPEQGPIPTEAQRRVLETLWAAIEAGRYAPFLLFGATGSGKTEVYLRAAEASLARGKGVLYLVPEIGLTPLLVDRLERRFPGRVAVLHSALSPRERYAMWRDVREGRRPFVVGARSAIFAPLPSLGLIVVDEEQDASYKQQESPRYHARDLAVVRARSAEAVLVLGSATPSLESFHHARQGRYTLLSLGGRVENRPLPEVQIVDMRREFQEAGEVRPISRALADALQVCLDRGEQALILRNRRGWAVALFCPACGERVTCPRCSVALTWHRRAARLRCHYCDFETKRPQACPRCGHEELREIGEGTERIEDELRRLVPQARVARMDRDTVRGRGAHARLLRRFEAHELDVLVGTQMIAKGHDFPGVTLVGVLSADQTLGLPDFRAAERTFQLLTQVAGRAGRGTRPGRVIVQAFDPQHPVLREAAAQNYEAFYEREIRYRRALRYPPLTGMVEILVVHRQASRAAAWAEKVAEALREEGGKRLLMAGPGPAPVERIRGLYREQILVRSAGRRWLVQTVARALQRVEGDVPRKALQVDVDPLSVL